MFFNIIYTTIVSIIIIFVVHNIFNYLKNTLTAPKVKDLINRPKFEYDKINNLLNSEENLNKVDSENYKTSKFEKSQIDTQEIKSELKDFFKELNNTVLNNENIDYQSYNDNNLNNNF